jgi:hypothetical protein
MAAMLALREERAAERARERREGGALYTRGLHLEIEANDVGVAVPPAPGMGPPAIDCQVWRLKISKARPPRPLCVCARA